MAQTSAMRLSETIKFRVPRKLLVRANRVLREKSKRAQMPVTMSDFAREVFAREVSLQESQQVPQEAAR